MECRHHRGRYLPGVDEDIAADILIAMLSPAFYVELTQEREWAPARAIDWLAATIPALIFEP